MNLAEYARAMRAEGAKVAGHGDSWWRQVRPFFWRPLLPFAAIPRAERVPSLSARLGGYQHVVPSGARSNSVMQFLIFRDAKAYDLAALKSARRWEVRRAAKMFSVRPVTDLTEFLSPAHRVFVSFYERTRYGYLTDRLAPSRFAAWAKTLLSAPGTSIYGAYAGRDLVAVNVTRVVDDTLIYSSFFARWEAMQQHVSSLMLHAVRTAAAERGDVERVFAGMRKSGAAQSIDRFYLLRGCAIETRPALLHLNPLIGWLTRLLPPDLSQKLGIGGK